MVKLRNVSRRRSARRVPLSVPTHPLAPRTSSDDSLSQRVYQSLKRDIITGVHPAGEVLSEKDLAEKYNSSRTPVREAAVRLQQEHLVKIVPNRGYFITKISVGDLNDLYDYRAAVECACAELAASKGVNPDLIEHLEKLARTEYKVNDRENYEEFITADTTIHIGIAQLARNRLLLQAVEAARCQMERIMYAAIDIQYYGEFPVREHCGILEAIKKRDPVTARRLMYEHILGSKDKVLKLATGDIR